MQMIAANLARTLYGLAVPFGVPSALKQSEANGGRPYHLIVDPTAFDKTLLAVRHNRAEVRLATNHSIDAVLCSTADGSLELWRDERGLYFQVFPRLRGAEAVALAGCLDRRRCSIAGPIVEATAFRRPDGTDVIVAHEVALTEISLVASPAFGETYAAFGTYRQGIEATCRSTNAQLPIEAPAPSAAARSTSLQPPRPAPVTEPATMPDPVAVIDAIILGGYQTFEVEKTNRPRRSTSGPYPTPSPRLVHPLH